LESTWKTGGIQAELSRKVQNTGVKEQELENAISVSQFHLENFKITPGRKQVSGHIRRKFKALHFSTWNS
jgi:hypothetical protein